MRILSSKSSLIFVLLALTGWSVRGQDAPANDATKTDASETGYTVTVQFSVDSAGSVTGSKVLKSDARVLNDFALNAVDAGRLNPPTLPAPGSDPKQFVREVFYPVPAYDSGKPLPAGVELPRPIFQPEPVYPFEYRKNKIPGGVWLSVTVDAKGEVTACKTIRASHPAFGPVAQDAVRRWKFKAATLKGQPVEATFNVPVSFQIGEQPYSWLWMVAPPPWISAYIVVSDAN